ncbi:MULTISPECIES: hypothetical protein [Caballeronia]|jgi:hypothetical protein|uniref:Uncharacterized protein n=2 Tax=Caballeronia TaxID=1827195 RepID=A0ACB5QSQ3_9BURK|nr:MULTISPECIES: hypothetical protein [unclassified Caballeronia]MBC8637098.1 hypothetical protein [Caballeronia sp. EK]GJH17762.1 hypothetical protein CBA19CS22_14490 [Caballeronia novacaledonica]
MKRTPFATVIVLAAATLAAPAFARDDGPRFAQDRLDELVAQHKEANRHIAQGPSQETHAQSKARHQSAS